jgi:hypothetical protein
MSKKFYIKYKVVTGLGSHIKTEWYPTEMDMEERRILLSCFGHNILEFGANNIMEKKE